jgi:hypothetical protein
VAPRTGLVYALSLTALLATSCGDDSTEQGTGPFPSSQVTEAAPPKVVTLSFTHPDANAGDTVAGTGAVAKTKRGAYTVTGEVVPQTAKVVFRNNATGGQRVAKVVGGEFSIRLALGVGENDYTVKATAAGYRAAEQSLAITRKKPPAPPPPPPPPTTTTEPPPEPDCHPNYDPCLDPNASDYDCEGGEGDGPKYTGPVTVKGGSDPYDLDRDGDGTGCDT